MKKYIAPILLIILVFAGGIILLSKSNDSKNETLTAVNAPEADTKKSLKTLKDLLKSQESQECRFSTDVSGYKSTGVIYTEDGKMRGDFNSRIENKEVQSHMVVLGNISYMWADGQNQGIKMTFDENNIEDAEKLASQAKLDINDEMDYDCKPVNNAEPLFMIPADVQFMNIEDIMKNIPTGSSSQCGECDKLEDEAKARCKEVLKCE